MPDTNFNYIYKIILIGDSGVGKTNITSRFVDDKFSEKSKTTIGIDFKTKEFIIDGVNIKAQIWDTGGQERFRCITRSYYQYSGGIIIAFDLTRRETFDNVEKWIKEIEYNMNDISKLEILIVGNKSDLVDKRQVFDNDIKDLKEKYDFDYIETSAKDDLNIKESFEDLVTRAHKRGLHVYSNKNHEFVNTIIIRDDDIVDRGMCICTIL